MNLDKITSKLSAKNSNLKGVSMKIDPGELVVISSSDRGSSSSLVDIMCCVENAAKEIY